MELSTSACNALWSIVFRPDPGAAVDVAADAADADDADDADDVDATADDVATGAAADVDGVDEEVFDELLHPAATSESAAAAAMSALRGRRLIELLAVIFSVVVIAVRDEKNQRVATLTATMRIERHGPSHQGPHSWSA